MPALYTKRPDATVGSIPHDFIVNFNYDILANATDQWVFIADTDYEVTRVLFIPTIAGTDGGAVTADVMKASGTTAVASGTTILSAADSLNLKATINTLVVGTLSTTVASIRLTTNDRLGINFTGVLTSATGLIQISLKRLQSANASF